MHTAANGTQFRQAVVYVRSSLWFVPSLIILACALMAVGLVGIEQEAYAQLIRRWPRWFANEAEGARAMLSAIATSMATIAGVVFSITVVALQLSSTQYTSRVLRNFMRDGANQTVLGVFVGVYVYCLLVLRTISSGDAGFVPNAAVLGGVVLAVVAIGFFIFFIHHISSAIQASEIVAAITRETREAIEQFFPEEIGEDSDEHALPEAMPEHAGWLPVPAREMGYLQRIEGDTLLAFARQHGTVVRMECAIGEFIAPGRPLLSLALPCRRPPEATREANDICAISTYRTIEQDPAFGLRQLVDIALKALSPSVNDTTTAVICIEHLTLLLCHCARRRAASVRRSDDGELRVIAKVVGFDRLVALSFGQILENSEHNTEVLFRLLVAIAQIARATGNRRRLQVLAAWLEAVAETASGTERIAYAGALIGEHLAVAREALQQQGYQAPH